MAQNASANGLDAEPQVFISYARQDAERVLAIARLLEDQGATVWRDADRILGGQYYGEQIVHAIAHSKVVLLMCSPQAFQSDNVHREVLLTWDHYHRRYLPVWLCAPTDVPERFRYCLAGCQWIDAHSQPPEQWLPQLLRAFRALGIETTQPAGPAGGATPRPADPPGEAPRRTLRFKPGDRPIRGADWELERLLGKGGFGEVWKAHNPHLSGLPPVALKFCLALDDRARNLLRHEANMVLQAQQQIRSEGIVPLLHVYLSNDPPCLEFPYIEGGTLVRLLDESRESSAGSFTPLQAQRIIQRIAQIVGPAHRATPKLIHRDLKPSNIMVERKAEGKVVLRVTDFGIGAVAAQPVLEHSRSSSSLEGNLSSVLTGSYSPLYASPQQMRGEKADPRDDIYALGVIWYQLLKANLSSPAPTGRKWIELLRSRGMSDAAIDLLSSCFESDPTDRPDDAWILAQQLQGLSTSSSTKSAVTAVELADVESETPRSPALSPVPPKTVTQPPPCETQERRSPAQSTPWEPPPVAPRRATHTPSTDPNPVPPALSERPEPGVGHQEVVPGARPVTPSSLADQAPAARSPTRIDNFPDHSSLPKSSSVDRRLKSLAIVHIAFGILVTALTLSSHNLDQHPRRFQTNPFFEISLFGSISCQDVLLALWVVASNSSPWKRIAGLVGAIMFMGTLMAATNDDSRWMIPEITMFVITPTATTLIALRALKVKVQQQRDLSQSARSDARRQKFSLRHVRFFIASVAVLGSWVLARVLFSAGVPFLVLLLDVVGLAALWATMGAARPLRRVSIVCALALIGAFMIEFLSRGSASDRVFLWWVVFFSVELLGTLLVVRACGYRLTRQGP